jgi:hypothetical protein
VVELTGSEMRKEDFIDEYMNVREATFRASTIISAFRKSGAYPINREVFMDDDFAPSIPYSTEARDFPSLPANLESGGSNVSDSDLDSDDSDGDSDGNGNGDSPCSHPPQFSIPEQHQLSTSQLEPMLRSVSPIAQSQLQSVPSTTTSIADTPSPITGADPLISIPSQQFYHDPVLFERIQTLEKEVQRLSGHVKMVEL